MAERRPVKAKVAGSSPARGAMKKDRAFYLDLFSCDLNEYYSGCDFLALIFGRMTLKNSSISPAKTIIPPPIAAMIFQS